ncbi:unnamed protein product [Clonostachys solani]|uniref:Uncharacterized protein n=1 Tax=Clonostachys solani TaxID=160281 RepID=A0A9N9ZA60_9HYPO|nr:unnamed protein product [Clonostachys solani]
MAQDHSSHPELVPTMEWVESAEIQESLDKFFQTSFSQDINRKIEAARANPLPEPKSRKLIAILVEAILLLLGVNPASCPEATEDCVQLCVKNNILKYHAWGDLRFVRNPDRISARRLEEKALATKMQLSLPFPEVGMLMVVTLLLKLERGPKSATSRAIKEHFLFERAKTAALVYDRESCSGIFAINNCPERYSFTVQDGDQATTVARTATSGPDDEFKLFGFEETHREIVIKDNGSSSDYPPPSGKRLASKSPQRTLFRPTPDAERESAAKQTSNIHGTSRPIFHTGAQETKRRMISNGGLDTARSAWPSKADIAPMATSRREEAPRFQAAPPCIPVQSKVNWNEKDMGSIMPARVRMLDDGKLIIESEAVQEMLNALRVIKGGLIRSDVEVAGNAYNQMISAFPERVRDAIGLTPIGGDTLAQCKMQTLTAQRVRSSVGRISKALEEVDEGVASIRASLSHEHHSIGILKQLLRSLEDELE